MFYWRLHFLAFCRRLPKGLKLSPYFCLVNEPILLFLIWQAEVRGQLESLRESTAKPEKVKTSVEHQPRRCKGRKFTSPNLVGVKGGVRLRDLADKHVRTRKKIQGLCLLIFFSLGYVDYNCLVDVVVTCFHTYFLSPGDCLLRSNK